MLYITIKSTDIDLLNYFCKKILRILKNTHYRLNGPIALPKKKKIYSVIRSSHVFSISKEEFGIIIYKRVFIFKVPFSFFSKKLTYLFFNNIKLVILKKKIMELIPSGISLKFTFKDK